MRLTKHRKRHQWIVWFYDAAAGDSPLQRGVIYTSRRAAKISVIRFLKKRRNITYYAIMMRWNLNIRDPQADAPFIWYLDFLHTEARWHGRSIQWQTFLVAEDTDALLESPITRCRYLKALKNPRIIFSPVETS